MVGRITTIIEFKPTFEELAETNSGGNIISNARTTDRAGHTANSVTGHSEEDELRTAKILRLNEVTFPDDVVETGIKKATIDYLITGSATIIDGITSDTLREDHTESEKRATNESKVTNKLPTTSSNLADFMVDEITCSLNETIVEHKALATFASRTESDEIETKRTSV